MFSRWCWLGWLLQLLSRIGSLFSPSLHMKAQFQTASSLQGLQQQRLQLQLDATANQTP